MGRMWLGIGAFSIAISIYGYLGDQRKQKLVTGFAVANYQFVDLRLPPMSNKVTTVDRKALDYAIDAWTQELGYFPIAKPMLMRGECFDLPTVLACSLRDVNTIIIAKTDGYDEKTIMLHEVGHLLGVPHIIDDPLMDPNYKKEQRGPSKFAVAIAKVVQQKGE